MKADRRRPEAIRDAGDVVALQLPPATQVALEQLPGNGNGDAVGGREAGHLGRRLVRRSRDVGHSLLLLPVLSLGSRILRAVVGQRTLVLPPLGVYLPVVAALTPRDVVAGLAEAEELALSPGDLVEAAILSAQLWCQGDVITLNMWCIKSQVAKICHCCALKLF